MKKCCIVLLTICCILLTTACKDKSTVNTDTKNTSSVSSEEEGNESINSQEPNNTEEEINKKTLKIPSLPLSTKYVGSKGTYTIVKITDISYHFDGTFRTLFIDITGEKTYDYEGNDANNTIRATFKLYNSEGYVIDNTDFFVEELKVGEKFRNKEIRFYHIPENCTSLTLEITDYD